MSVKLRLSNVKVSWITGHWILTLKITQQILLITDHFIYLSMDLT